MPSYAGLNFKACLALAQAFGYAAGKVPSIIYSQSCSDRMRGALAVIVGSTALV